MASETGWKPRCTEDTVDAGVHPAVAAMRMAGGGPVRLDLQALGRLGFTPEGLGPSEKKSALQSPPRDAGKKGKKQKKKHKKKEKNEKRGKKDNKKGDKKRKSKHSKKKASSSSSSSSSGSSSSSTSRHSNKNKKTKKSDNGASKKDGAHSDGDDDASGAEVVNGETCAQAPAASAVVLSAEEVESDDSAHQKKRAKVAIADVPPEVDEAAVTIAALERRDLAHLPSAVQLLENGLAAQQEAVAAAIGNITPSSVDKDGNIKAAVGKSGVIPILVRLLSKGSFEMQAQVTRALHCLTFKNAENKAAVAKAGAIPPLISVLRTGTLVAAERAAGVLRNLTGGNVDNKAAVAAGGAIPLLVAMLGATKLPEAQINIAVVLYNLANDNTDRRSAVVQAGAAEPLVSLMKSGKPEVQKEAVDTLRVLAMHSAKNCTAIVEAGAVPPLATLLRATGMKQATLLRDNLQKFGGPKVHDALAKIPK